MAEGLVREPEKKVLSVDDFLSKAAPKTKTFFLAELAGEITVREISISEREEIRSGSTNFQNGKLNEADFIALTVLKGLISPRLTPEHVSRLRGSSFGLLNKIHKEIWGLSGLLEDSKNA